jgi:hypothetical protein
LNKIEWSNISQKVNDKNNLNLEEVFFFAYIVPKPSVFQTQNIYERNGENCLPLGIALLDNTYLVGPVYWAYFVSDRPIYLVGLGNGMLSRTQMRIQVVWLIQIRLFLY